MMLHLNNAFSTESHHPKHLRNASCHMLLKANGRSVAVMLVLEHEWLLEQFADQQYVEHYEFFWHRALHISTAARNGDV